MRRIHTILAALLIPTISILLFAVSALGVRTVSARVSSGSDQQSSAGLTSRTAMAHTDIRAMEVVTGADLRIIKFSAPHDTVLAGEQFTYTIIVDNLGPITATNIVVTDTLVSSGFVRANGCSLAVRTNDGTIDEFDCNFALSTGVFNLATMGANFLNPRSTTDMGRMIITINATADQENDLTNTATVTSDTYDPDTSNNLATDTISVQAVADLEISKTALGEVQVSQEAGDVFDITEPGDFPFTPSYTTSTDLATAGRRIAYSVRVTNTGPSNAMNVLLVDNLPDGVTIVPNSLAFSGGACNTGGQQITCGLGTLAVGASETLQFHVYVDPGLEPGSLLANDALVLADTYDTDNSNDYASTLATVNTWADMEITQNAIGQVVTGYDNDLREHKIGALPGGVTPGMIMRYEITVQNTGPSDAQGVQVLNLLPGQQDTGFSNDATTFLYASGAACEPMDNQQELGIFGPGVDQGKFGQVMWCDLGTVPVGARTTFNIYVQTDPSIPNGTTLTNGAYVWWGPSSPPADPGAFLGFPFPQIPAELPTTDDPDTENNFAAAETDTSAVADVWITKVDAPADNDLDMEYEPDLAVAGDEHRYLITIGNHGPSDAQDIDVQDFLDFKKFGVLGETFLRCEPFDIDDFVSCSEQNGVVDLNLMLKQNEQIIPGQLNAGEEFQFYIITKVSPAYVLEADDFIVTNDSRITTSTRDYKTANNVDAHDSLIVGKADLSITKESEYHEQAYSTPEAAGVMTYTITVTNHGPSDAAEVNVVDYLPDGLVLDPAHIQVSVTNGSVASVADDGRVTIIVGNDLNTSGNPQLGRMNVGTTEVITIVAYVRDDVETSTLVNHAVVETRQNSTIWPTAPDLLPGIGGGQRTPTADPDLSNNSASTGDPLVDSADLMITKSLVQEYAFPGDAVTYMLVITNSGPMQAENVVVTDYMPTSVDYQSSDISVPGVCLGITTLTCHIGHMNPGEAVTIMIHGVLNPDIPLDALVKNDVSVFSDDFDPNLVDNYASLSFIVGEMPFDEVFYLPFIAKP